jgi:hypothetical protein
MGLETIEPPAVVYIDSLVSSNPVGGTDKVKTLDNHIRGIKNALLLSFPNIDGAVTPTPAEFNVLAAVVAGAAAANKALVLDGDSKILSGIVELVATTFTGALVGNADTATNASNADTVTTNANLTGDVTSVGNATTIGNNKVKFNANIKLGTANGSWSVAPAATQTIPRGIYYVHNGTSGAIVNLQGLINGSWRGIATLSYLGGYICPSDGTSLRLQGSIGTATMHYEEIFD